MRKVGERKNKARNDVTTLSFQNFIKKLNVAPKTSLWKRRKEYTSFFSKGNISNKNNRIHLIK